MTTIALSEEVKTELGELKEHPRESYEAVVKRLLKNSKETKK